jgi:ceramide glucosyltransferase
MGFTVLLVALAVALAAAVQSVLLAVQAWEHRRFVRSSLGDLARHRPQGRVMLVAPCKGLDVALEVNLHGLFDQDYRDYELVMVVESADDPACAVIRRVMAAHPEVASRLVIAGRAAASGQKVHNLLAATAGVPAGIDYLAFVDSDARPRRQWLRMLVARLGRPEIGAVTGYRWFLPQRRSLPNYLIYAINCGVTVLLNRRCYHFVWGGSWAIRREVFEAIGLRHAWRGTLSDDLVASRQLRRAGLQSRFEPACVVGSPLDQSWGEMLSFLRRQYVVARCYMPWWWRFALVFSTLSAASWPTALLAVVLAAGRGGLPLAASLGLGAVLLAGSVYRGWLRQDTARIEFPEQSPELQSARRFDVWLGPLVAWVHWLGILSSAFGRVITWRGNRYRILRGGQIRRLGPGAQSAARSAEPPRAADRSTKAA